MTEKMIQFLTVIFRHKGKDTLTEQEFVYTVSMDKHWFPPKSAQVLLDRSVKEGLLKLSHGMLVPAFELSDEHLEMDYRPPADLLKEDQAQDKADMFMDIVSRIASSSKLPKREVVARINKVRERMNIDVEVAALVVARGLGVEIDKEIAAVQRELVSRV